MMGDEADYLFETQGINQLVDEEIRAQKEEEAAFKSMLRKMIAAEVYKQLNKRLGKVR
jgi:hypothetical protein